MRVRMLLVVLGGLAIGIGLGVSDPLDLIVGLVLWIAALSLLVLE